MFVSEEEGKRKRRKDKWKNNEHIEIVEYIVNHQFSPVQSLSHVQTQGLQPTRLLCPWGFSRQEYWSGLPCLPPKALPNPRMSYSCLRILTTKQDKTKYKNKTLTALKSPCFSSFDGCCRVHCLDSNCLQVERMWGSSNLYESLAVLN